MEQQVKSQQSVVPPTSPIQQQPSGKNKIVYILLGVIVLLIIAGLWLFSQSGTSPVTQNGQNQNVLDQQQRTQPEKIIEWGMLSSIAPIKTIASISTYSDTILVFNVGTIISGEYKGKILAFATPKNAYDAFKTNTNVLFYYSYFVSDDKGNVIAWDKSFVHDPDTRCYDSTGVQGCEKFYLTKQQLGMTDALQKSLTFIPKELENISYLTTTEKHADFKFKIGYGSALAIVDVNSPYLLPVDKTESGLQIVKQVNDNDSSAQTNVLPSVSYYIILPFGKAVGISPEPNFVDANDVPQLSWTIGAKPVASYRYGEYAYGWQDCYDGISTVQLQSALVQTGITTKSDPVYEIDSSKYPKVYQCLHDKTKRYVYDSVTQTGTYQDTVSYADFILSHPMFFWKHQLGDLIAFVRSDVVPAAEKAKPVVYLYPEKLERVNVKVSPIGGFIKTDPAYENGWIVDATPGGIITNTKDGKQYPYLFWEGGKDGVVETPKQGFVVAKNDIASVLNTKLSLFGLNDKERSDFLEFWVPKLSEAPYYFITFISRSEIDRVSPMTISPTPKSVIRLLMDYKPLTQPVSVEPLIITPTERSGFTVVEWGGIVRN